nr:hypothetical protein [Wenjunlia tyrosinilytica]
MPRPTPAQLAYGTATVVFSTLAMLLLSEARSGVGVVVIAVVGLALGTLVAISAAPSPRRASAKRRRTTTVPTSSVPSSGGAQSRVSEPSLRR